MNLERIRQCVERANALGGRQEYFGPLPESDVAAVEQALGVTFPEEYRVFLREFGGGGAVAAPFSGIPTRNPTSMQRGSVYGDTVRARQEEGLPQRYVVVFVHAYTCTLWVIDTQAVRADGTATVQAYLPQKREGQTVRVARSFREALELWLAKPQAMLKFAAGIQNEHPYMHSTRIRVYDDLFRTFNEVMDHSRCTLQITPVREDWSWPADSTLPHPPEIFLRFLRKVRLFPWEIYAPGDDLPEAGRAGLVGMNERFRAEGGLPEGWLLFASCGDDSYWFFSGLSTRRIEDAPIMTVDRDDVDATCRNAELVAPNLGALIFDLTSRFLNDLTEFTQSIAPTVEELRQRVKYPGRE